jgi:hypothetical protein
LPIAGEREGEYKKRNKSKEHSLQKNNSKNTFEMFF